jgi:fucose permease
MVIGRSLTTLGLAGFVALGLPEGATGIAWPSMAEDFDQDISRLGLLLVALVVGYFLASALTGPITQRLGIGRTLTASSAVSAVALLGFALSPTWAVLVMMLVLLGAGGGLIDAGLNAHTALHGGQRVMHLLHASFGIGATVGPLIMALFLVGPGSWRMGFAVFGVIQLGLTVAFFDTRDRWESTQSEAPSPDRLRLTGAITSSLALFAVYTGLEVAAGQWAYSVLTEERGLAAGAAGIWVAGFWASLTLGRLLAGAIGDRGHPQHLIVGGGLTAVAGTALFWASPAIGAGAGLLLTGFGLAPVFPMMVLLTPDRVGRDQSTAVIGYQLAAAAVGAAVLPGGVGLLVAQAGLGAVAPALLTFAVATVVTIEFVRRTPDPATV